MFERRVVIQGICDLLPNGAPIADIVERADLIVVQSTAFRSPARVLRRSEPGTDGPSRPERTMPRYSTPDMLAAARRLVVTALRRTGDGVGTAPEQRSPSSSSGSRRVSRTVSVNGLERASVT